MKIRYNYVSNSSSSSCIVYGEEVNYAAAIREAMEKSQKVWCILEGMGTSGECADFVFTLTKYRIEMLKRRNISIDIPEAKFVKVFSQFKCNDYNTFRVKQPLSNGRLMEIRKDYKSPETDANN